jgi:hypothetical protein
LILKTRSSKSAPWAIADLVGHKGTSVTERVYRRQLKPVITKGVATMNAIFTPKKEAKSA